MPHDDPGGHHPDHPELLSLVARIDEFKGAWRALRTLAPDRLSALLRVATIECIGSSTRIEGSKLSDREVEQLLSNLNFQEFATRDKQEVAGYTRVMDDTLPGGPVRGTIQYVAPLSLADREQDCRIAWAHFASRAAPPTI